MKIGVLGTGMVGNTIATKLIELGHEVKMGSRTAGNEKAVEWVEANGEKASEGTFADAAKFGEIVFNCTSGGHSLEALEQTGAENIKGKVLIDVANPLDFSHGMPPTLSICNTDSLGESIQRTYPDTKVVKTLNTVNTSVMVNPKLLSEDTIMYICGNDADAKKQVSQIVTEWFGWKELIDLGDITNARATEMLLPIWIRLYGIFGDPKFNFKIVK